MKQLIQDLMKGDLQIVDNPFPKVRDNYVLIKSEMSLISFGTEKMLLDFGKANMLSKAKQQPEKVKQVMDKIKTDGFASTFSSVKRKLNDPLPLGYSNVGKVIEIGKGVENISVGDNVLSNGPHAEIVNVPSNLVSRIPNSVTSEDAVFGVIGAIALQSVRLVNPTIGETICVIGIGLVGNILTQILLANGCNVIAIDNNSEKLTVLKNKNVKKINNLLTDDIEKEIYNISSGHGVDAVIIATATQSNEPLIDAIKITRSKGRIVVVGTVGMNINRDLLFKKEISIQVSRSYGPGRYDPKYEDKNQDYPLDHVRWTAGRNFKAFLLLLQNKQVSLSHLTKSKYRFNDALEVYKRLDKNNTVLGTILIYEDTTDLNNQRLGKVLKNKKDIKEKIHSTNHITLGFIGSGNYAQSVLLPSLNKMKVNLKALVSRNPVTASYLGKKYKFKKVSCNLSEILDDNEINTVFIATNHDSHANLVIECLKNNKNIYIEKPLCLNNKELNSIIRAHKSSKARLIVGFNRRFAPYYQLSKSLLSISDAPSVINIMINAGVVEKENWVNDKIIGGGRVIGEMCHFLDLLVFLTNSLILDLNTSYLNHSHGKNIFVTLKLANGSIGNIHYITNGNRSFPKERVEIFQSEKIVQINNFKSIKFFGWKNQRSKFSFIQNKGAREMINVFLKSSLKKEVMSMEEIINVTKASFEIDKTN
jgi:predicted dehydrogenase/threonine dehydrogenase-like Zn-dependent dehydrogenase